MDAWLGLSLCVGMPGWRLARLATVPFILTLKIRVYVKLNLFIYAKPKSLFTFRGLLNFGKVVELKIIKAYDFGIISFKGYIILLIFF